MDEIDVETLTNQAKKFRWLKGKVNLQVVSSSKESSKRLLIGKILSKKSFPKVLVKEILVKAWNIITDFDVALVDKNVFVFSFNHEADVRRAWDRRPWLIKGEHLILKRFSLDQSVEDVDFSTTEFWIQVHNLPLDRQSKENLLKIGSIADRAMETDFIGSNEGVWRRYIQVRVEVDINCSLALGFPLERDHLLELWVPFKYEKLGNFCFGCGLLGHDQRDCQDKGDQLLIKEGVIGFFSKWLRADNDEFQPRRKLGSHVEGENEESNRVNVSNTGNASSRIQENLEHCVEAAEPVQVDGISIQDTTIRLSERLVNLDSRTSSVNHQPDGSTPNTHQPDGSTSFTSWNLVS
nr:hypothetical protein CFP56_49398 [Quercus suber]